MRSIHPLMLAAVLTAASPVPAFATGGFNTALSQAEVDKIMNGTCSLQRGYARDAAARQGEPWDVYMRRANQVMLTDMDIADIQRMIRAASAQSAGGNRDEREIADFQLCILDAKITYAEAHEKNGKR